MSKPARRKDLERLAGTLEHVADAMAGQRQALEDVASQNVTTRRDLGCVVDTLTGHGVVLGRLERELRQWPANMDMERVETLMNGVKVALERTGGNVLPSFRNDVLALRDQMSEFRRELSGYRAALMRLTKWIDDDVLRPYEERVGPAPLPTKPKRKYNRRKKGDEASQSKVEISAQDVAPHNGSDEEQDIKP